jgi:hypothetical protein
MRGKGGWDDVREEKVATVKDGSRGPKRKIAIRVAPQAEEAMTHEASY